MNTSILGCQIKRVRRGYILTRGKEYYVLKPIRGHEHVYVVLDKAKRQSAIDGNGYFTDALGRLEPVWFQEVHK